MEKLVLLLLIISGITYGMNSMGEVKEALRERYEKKDNPAFLRSVSEGPRKNDQKKVQGLRRIRKETLSPHVKHKKSE